MADSKTLVEIVEKSYCTASSDILWEKSMGQESRWRRVCSFVTHTCKDLERSANLLCVQVHEELLLLLLQRSSERASGRECSTLSSRARLFRSCSSRSASRMRSQIEILSLSQALALLSIGVPSNEISMFQVLTPPRCLRIQILKNVDGSGSRSQTRSQCIQKLIFLIDG